MSRSTNIDNQIHNRVINSEFSDILKHNIKLPSRISGVAIGELPLLSETPESIRGGIGGDVPDGTKRKSHFHNRQRSNIAADLEKDLPTSAE